MKPTDQKRALRVLLAALVVLLVLVKAPGQDAGADTLTLVSPDWCPLVCESGRPGVLAKEPGAVVEIVRAIFEEKGHRIVYSAPPWSRAIFATRKGSYTGILAAMKNDAPDFIYPEEEIGLNRMCFYVKAANPWRYQGVESLTTVVLGVIQDYAYDNGEVDDYIKKSRAAANSQVQTVASKTGLEQNFNNLEIDRITVILDECRVVDWYLRNNNLTGTYQQAGCLAEVKMYVAFSPALEQSARYAALFSQGIRALRRSGRLQAILAKYGLKDWKNP